MFPTKWDLVRLILVYLKYIGFGTWIVVSWMLKRILKQWEVNPLCVRQTDKLRKRNEWETVRLQKDAPAVGYNL